MGRWSPGRPGARESSDRGSLDLRRMLHLASSLAGRDPATTALTALLLSRVILLGEIAPFGIAYLAAVRAARPRFAPAAFLGLAAGLLTTRPLLWALEGLGLALVVCWLVGFPPALATRKAGRVFAVAAMVLVAGLAVGAVGLILSGVSPLGLARVVIEAGLASIFAAVALDALPILYPRGVPGMSGQRLSALVLLAVERATVLIFRVAYWMELPGWRAETRARSDGGQAIRRPGMGMRKQPWRLLCTR